MRYNLLFILSLVFLSQINVDVVYSQEQTVGVFINEEGAYEGYTLFSPIWGTDIYLIDNCGRLIHTWPSDTRPHGLYLMDDGSILKQADSDDFHGVEQIDWDGNVIFQYSYPDPDIVFSS